MIRPLISLLAALALITRTQADDAVNRLVSGHDQAVQNAALPLHRKLLSELQKVEAQYAKSGQKVALAEARSGIARVKQQITETAMPANAAAGPKPADFKLVYFSQGSYALGSWENGEMKALDKGFSWTNKGPRVAIVFDTVMEGAFEAEFSWKGFVDTQSLGEADYSKYCELFTNIANSDEKHTLKVKRSAAGAITATLDGKPFTYGATKDARQDMFLRFMFYVGQNVTVEFRDAVVKDLPGKR